MTCWASEDFSICAVPGFIPFYKTLGWFSFNSFFQPPDAQLLWLEKGCIKRATFDFTFWGTLSWQPLPLLLRFSYETCRQRHRSRRTALCDEYLFVACRIPFADSALYQLLTICVVFLCVFCVCKFSPCFNNFMGSRFIALVGSVVAT